MVNVTQLEIGAIALIQQQQDGRIVQIALTVEQSKLLQIFLASISKSSSLVQMSEDYDLILKSSLKK